MSTDLPAAAPPDYRRVLVPLDGSELASAALVPARALAGRFGAEVHVISVVSDETEEEATRAHAATLMEVDAVDPRIHVEVGEDVAEAIRGRADALGSCIVCMSSHGRGRVAGALVGSVARQVIEATGEPTIVVGPSATADPDGFASGPLLACVDGSPDSEGILPLAAGWAEALSMPLTVLTVAEPAPPPERPEATWYRQHGPQMDADEYVAELAGRWASAGATGRVVYDPVGPAAGIEVHLRSNPAAMLAVNTHARSGLGRVVFGSGAASIVAVSTVPVLVAPLLEGP